MIKEIYVPYDFNITKGTKIKKEGFSKGKELWESTTAFCKENLTSTYEIDNKVLSQGIRVQVKNKKDAKLLTDWMSK